MRRLNAGQLIDSFKERREEMQEKKDNPPFPGGQKAPDNRGLPIGNQEVPKGFGGEKNAAQETAHNLLNEENKLYKDELRRKDDLRRSMADPNYLSKKEAIDRQNSFGKPRGRGQGKEQLSEREELLRRQRLNEAAVLDGGVRKRGNVPSLRAGLSDADRRVKADMEQNLVKALGGDMGDMSHKRENRLPETAGRISVLGSFDLEAYLGPQRMVEGGGDKMKNFQYNQVVSDATRPDRYLKDYRNPQ